MGAEQSAIAAGAALDGEVRTDVAIVGGGMLGLTLALHPAAAGIGALVPEARQVGFGA